MSCMDAGNPLFHDLGTFAEHVLSTDVLDHSEAVRYTNTFGHTL